ncbi:MAG: 6-carboxytetrahydropterin synthase [Fimbriimonadaceae bacterium]|nr:6-carboxytetrahydropterin synthase [Fimbriimonadaceae bacterium]
MTRRITFSSGHRYWRSDRSPEENRALFGVWASPYNHGHNYVLDVEVEGSVNGTTGMVVNIKRLDDLLKSRIKSVFDQRSINDEVPALAEKSASLEHLLLFIAGEIADEHDHVRLPETPDARDTTAVRMTGLRLEETPTLYGELLMPERTVTITRIYEFAAAHRLYSSALTEAENIALYGKCQHVHGHGHNYTLEVTVAGTPDPLTGFAVDLSALDAVVTREILDRYDHRNLNIDVEELAGRITSSEVVTQAIFDRLRGPLAETLRRVRLWETPRNAFEVSA